MLWKYAICVIVAYFLGSFNGAVVTSRLFFHEDVRTKGSGNAGLTNFHRNYGGWVTLLVIAIDMGKMVGAALLARFLLPGDPDLASMIAGFAVLIGHLFPAIFGFRGGKGILSAASLSLVLDWRIFVITLSVFIVVFALSHYVSLGSILGCIVYGICYAIFFPMQPAVWIIAMTMAFLAIFMHRSNIQRLFRGEERKTYLIKSKNE